MRRTYRELASCPRQELLPITGCRLRAGGPTDPSPLWNEFKLRAPSPKEAAMTRSKLSTKAVLLAGASGLSTAVFAGSQPADAQYFPTGTVDYAGYGPTTGGVGYYGYYYGDPNGAYGTVRRWGAPVYDHGSVHGFGHRMGRA